MQGVPQATRCLLNKAFTATLPDASIWDAADTATSATTSVFHATTSVITNEPPAASTERPTPLHAPVIKKATTGDNAAGENKAVVGEATLFGI